MIAHKREDGITCQAEFSYDRVYRYWLGRFWESYPKNLVIFVGLNPSTADETTDDPTVRRCVCYAKDWGYGGMVMLNAFAFRATDPRTMKLAADPIGPLNDAFINGWTTYSDVVACWGVHGDFLLRGRHLTATLRGRCRDRLYVFGLTKDGHPKHPLYLAKTNGLEKWR